MSKTSNGMISVSGQNAYTLDELRVIRRFVISLTGYTVSAYASDGSCFEAVPVEVIDDWLEQQERLKSPPVIKGGKSRWT